MLLAMPSASLRSAFAAVVVASTLALPLVAGAPDDEPKKIATAYLDALSGKGDGSARDYLLGGVTLTAEDFSIPNWKIVERHPPRREKASIAAAVKAMKELDKAGRSTLSSVVNLDGDEAVASLSQEQADKLMAPTRKMAKELKEKFPVFSYVARVGKDVFWHPSNPWRAVIDEMGDKGDYMLELHLFRIEEKEVGHAPRVWPLRVLRIKTATYDSGWKILPASDWDPEY